MERVAKVMAMVGILKDDDIYHEKRTKDRSIGNVVGRKRHFKS